jgi:hypothetical protein
MNNPLDPQKISKLADDIRTIQDYTQSQGFDTSLLRAEVTTPERTHALKDTPIVCTAISILFLVGCLATFAYVEELSAKTLNFIFVIGLIFVTTATISIHKKFSNNTITIVCATGLSAVLLIGSGNFTPKEAATLAQQQLKKEDSK